MIFKVQVGSFKSGKIAGEATTKPARPPRVDFAENCPLKTKNFAPLLGERVADLAAVAHRAKAGGRVRDSDEIKSNAGLAKATFPLTLALSPRGEGELFAAAT